MFEVEDGVTKKRTKIPFSDLNALLSTNMDVI